MASAIFEFVDGTREVVWPGSPRHRELLQDGHAPVGSVPESDGVSDALQEYLDSRSWPAVDDAVQAAEDAATAAVAVGTTNDAVIAGRVNDSASATRAALSATFVPGGDDVKAGARRGTFGGLPASPFVGAALDLPSPYSNDSQYVHPDVVDAGPGKWNGWRYWMAATPYPHSDAGKENPCILVSSDGLNWQEPTGITNPVILPPTPPRWNSDPDMVLVGSTMHLFVRESAVDGEWMKHLTSTDGITWANLGTVIDAGTSNPAGNFIISPGVIHDGSQFLMFTSKTLNTVEKRTSADGNTWSAPTTCTLTGYTGSGIGHVDVVKKSGSSDLFILIQAQDTPSSDPETPSARKIWLGRSSNAGATWTFDAEPLLDSRGLGTRNVYRTCGLHETRDGDDYFRLWYSGIDLDHKGREVWHIGYTEGYAPSASRPATGLSIPGNLEVSGDISVEHVGVRRLFSRIMVATRVMVSYLSAWRADFGHAYIDQSASSSTTPFWKDLFGYSAGKIAPLVIASAKDRESFNGARAEIRMHQRGTDNSGGTEAKDYWSLRTLADGSIELMWFDFSASTEKVVARFTNAADLLTGLRDLSITRNMTVGNHLTVTGRVSGAESVYGTKADFGTGADGTQPSNNPLRVMGDNLRITTARTPTSTADANLNTGAICWDANYIYVKTAAGWKRTALTTF